MKLLFSVTHLKLCDWFFDSVSFSSYFKSISHLREKEARTLGLGFKCCLAMISPRAVNFSSLSFLGFSFLYSGKLLFVL